MGATPCCFRLRGGFSELCPGGGRRGLCSCVGPRGLGLSAPCGTGARGLCALRKPPSAGVPGPLSHSDPKLESFY